MKLSVRLRNRDLSGIVGVRQPRHISALELFRIYPIFLLVFGPPVFRPSMSVDITQGKLDIWSYSQAGLIVLVAIPAILRLVAANTITIPIQVRSILRLAIFLGLLFMLSTVYTTSRITTVAYSICYFLTLICMVEFIARAYWNPPNWMQCLYQLRLIALILLVIVFLTLFFNSSLVLNSEIDTGFRFLGGGVAPMPVICPIIAIISAHTLLYNLESRIRSVFFLFVGLAGTLITRSRGSEIALLFALAVVVIFWARLSRSTMYLFIFGFILIILLFSGFVEFIGTERIWNIFNRGEEVSGIQSASGRTYIWSFVLHYCISHPWGMGYVAGFRTLFRNYYSPGLPLVMFRIGNAHNSFIQVLADAGWLALIIYLIMMARIAAVGWRTAKVPSTKYLEYGCAPGHVMACALALLVFCLVCGITGADFVVPMRASFYYQNVIIAIILGAYAKALITDHSKSRLHNI